MNLVGGVHRRGGSRNNFFNLWHSFFRVLSAEPRDRGQDVELMLNVQDKKMVLGSSGLEAADLPAAAVQAGLLDYAPETQTVTGTFEQVFVCFNV